MSAALVAKTCVRERPILFMPEMVLAVLDDRKDQTRRVVKEQPKVELFAFIGSDNKPTGDFAFVDHPRVISKHIRCPYGVPGDRLWVRENLRRTESGIWIYGADKKPVLVSKNNETAMTAWAHHKQQNYCPSMFMPRWASRITLEVTEVRVQRIQEISEEDAKAEGIAEVEGKRGVWDGGGPAMGPNPQVAFMRLWNSINESRGYGWDANPWVWVIGFRRVN